MSIYTQFVPLRNLVTCKLVVNTELKELVVYDRSNLIAPVDETLQFFAKLSSWQTPQNTDMAAGTALEFGNEMF